jgi:DNA-binding CsgD family transcriptional regulator
VLEALPDAVFALDGEGTVLFANRAAELVLQSGDGVACERSKLRARLHAERDQLDRLIREAAVLGIAGAGGWVRVSRLNGGPPYAAYVAPLNCGDEELLTAQTRVLVIVHDTAQHRAAEPNMLMQIYALTDAEARLASALSAGHSIESAAANLGVQPTTARSQLKSVFRKVGVNRQQDLVRVLSSLPAKG